MDKGYKNTAAWDKFASSGKICDYLQYKHACSQEIADETDDKRVDNKGTADGRG